MQEMKTGKNQEVVNCLRLVHEFFLCRLQRMYFLDRKIYPLSQDDFHKNIY